jgi:sec-independent protein translocase protein TatA
MGRLGIPELVIILVIVILIFGANRLPEIGRGIGRGIRNFKDATTKDGEGAEKAEKS